MIHRVYEEEGNLVTELDSEGIELYIEALTQLRDEPPGEELSTSAYEVDHDGTLLMGDFILRRAPDN